MRVIAAGAFVFVFVLGTGNSPGGEGAGADQVVVAEVEKAPLIDGQGDDEPWKVVRATETVARGVFPNNKDTVTEVRVHSVRTGSHVYFLVRWRDATQDDQAHKPFVWDEVKNAYGEGLEREDMFSIAFEHTGPFDSDMLSGTEAVWDVWHWKATRTNPQGYAMDRTHRHTREQWQGKGKSFEAKNGGKIWIARPEDAGDTVEKKQAAPGEKKDERMPQYLPGTPTGSAADVKAKGTWAGGWWTVEFERRLDTGHADDTKFELGRSYKMAISVHDRTGDMDKASGVLELTFGAK